MLIQPDGVIRLIKNCPLDSDYKNTVFFENKEQQLDSFLRDLTYTELTKQSYQRYSLGVLQIQMSADKLYDYNYLMFKNASYGDKWFYAFINKIEYVNNLNCRIYYSIDVIQTWFYDCTILSCFVEREHSLTDNPGDNIIEESVSLGEYVYGALNSPIKNSKTMSDLSCVIIYNQGILDLSYVAQEYGYNKGLYSGVYQGVNFVVVPINQDNVEILDDLFRTIDSATFGGFLSAVLMPTIFVPMNDNNINSDGKDTNVGVDFELTRPNNIDGHTPRNKKLLTYPYICAHLTSNRGTGNDFAFEYFRDGTATFRAEGNMCSSPSSMAYPMYYKGQTNYLDGAVSIDNYPICTWGSNGVVEWLNNNMFKQMAGVTSSLVGVMATNLRAPTTQRNLQAFENNQMFTAVTAPAELLSNATSSLFSQGEVHGNISGDILIGNHTGRRIYAKLKTITKQYAEIIDYYFDAYGYATNRIKVPNIGTRPTWNYIKTRGCNLIGGAPADEIKAICNIFDRGITFWKHFYFVGRYEMDNSV